MALAPMPGAAPGAVPAAAGLGDAKLHEGELTGATKVSSMGETRSVEQVATKDGARRPRRMKKGQ